MLLKIKIELFLKTLLEKNVILIHILLEIDCKNWILNWVWLKAWHSMDEN
jgi:hypothetical protein